MEKMKRTLAAAVMTLSLVAFAQAEPEFRLVIENHKFTPERVEVPAGKKVKLTIENRDATPEEFESKQLNREKVIPGKSTGIVYIGPLKPGEYKFVGEFNEAAANGVIVAK
jgi:plastocyanin